MLWESETRRVMSDAAYLYSNFEDPELYLASISNAQSLGILLWADNHQQLLAIRHGGEILAGQFLWMDICIWHRTIGHHSHELLVCEDVCSSGRKSTRDRNVVLLHVCAVATSMSMSGDKM